MSLLFFYVICCKLTNFFSFAFKGAGKNFIKEFGRFLWHAFVLVRLEIWFYAVGNSVWIERYVFLLSTEWGGLRYADGFEWRSNIFLLTDAYGFDLNCNFAVTL